MHDPVGACTAQYNQLSTTATFITTVVELSSCGVARLLFTGSQARSAVNGILLLLSWTTVVASVVSSARTAVVQHHVELRQSIDSCQ
jgi:glycerol-3-phosphate acyltransferase PlsY